MLRKLRLRQKKKKKKRFSSQKTYILKFKLLKTLLKIPVHYFGKFGKQIKVFLKWTSANRLHIWPIIKMNKVFPVHTNTLFKCRIFKYIYDDIVFYEKHLLLWKKKCLIIIYETLPCILLSKLDIDIANQEEYHYRKS